MANLEIFIARHGQNEDNVNGILNGHRDLPLSELGREQAHNLAEGIEAAGLNIDTVYSSPLDRALETARIVCNVLAIEQEPIVIPELIERDFGVMTGVPISEVETRCSPDIIKTDTITYFLNPEKAETFPDLIKRGQKALEHVRALQTEGTALLVCHGDIGKMVYVAATGKHWEDVLRNFHFGNGDLIEVSSSDETHKVRLPQHNL
jgi:broad specificity phosphatase PhoE